jgi:6-phosphogluconate dehydrogenase
MVPAGPITAATVTEIASHVESGDVIVDGGNSRFTDTQERAEHLGARGIHLVDSGTSGGIWGLREGFCLMIGADRKIFELLEPIFKTLAPEDGYAHVGPTGSGHFVKMVHNGVEYGLMQSYAEGFELMRASEFDLDLAVISDLWRHGSVVRSWLLDLAASALKKDPDLKSIAGYVEDSGEGRWAVETGINSSVPTPAMAAALFARFASRQDESFAAKVLAALRREFGGHAVHPATTDGDETS